MRGVRCEIRLALEKAMDKKRKTARASRSFKLRVNLSLISLGYFDTSFLWFHSEMVVGTQVQIIGPF